MLLVGTIGNTVNSVDWPCTCCRLIQRLVDLAEEAGCYKVILDCAESNAAFYAKAGLARKEVQMVSGRAGNALVL